MSELLQALESIIANDTTYQSTPEPIVIVRNRFNENAVKFLGRKDIFNDSADLDSGSFTAVSVGAIDGEMLIVRNGQVRTTLLTEASDSVLFEVSRLQYGHNEKQGAKILAGVKVYSESKDTLYVGASMDESGNIVIDSIRVKNRNAGSVYFPVTLTWGNAVISERESLHIVNAIGRFIRRAESGKKASDSRVEKIGNKFTAYGMLRDSRKAK